MPFPSSVRNENFIRFFKYCITFVPTSISSDGSFSYANIFVFLISKILVRDRRGDTGFQWGNLKDRDRLEDLGEDRKKF
jgi:hypothetical protein